jgi:hypothetical protein
MVAHRYEIHSRKKFWRIKGFLMVELGLLFDRVRAQ